VGFSEFHGNTKIVAALRSMLAAERVPHAMLFTGPAGVGKYTLARLFAQAANCQQSRDDACGECEPCRKIAQLADPRPLIRQGLEQRGERPDAATVERIPLLLQTHPDVWVIVPDPVRPKDPVAHPVLHVGQLRAIQRAAYFKPTARRRVFILDGAETMQWQHASIFLKILEEPPESATLILLAPNPHLLLPTIRSRCLQFAFAPLPDSDVEQILRSRTDWKSAERKLAAQIAEGSPGAALALDLDAALQLRRDVLAVLEHAADLRAPADLFVRTAALAKSQDVAFEIVLEVFYSLLTDLLELSGTSSGQKLRNPVLRKELEVLSRKVSPDWVSRAVGGLDQLHGRLRRNINRALGLDAVTVSLGAVR